MFRSLLVLAAMSTPAFADATYVHAELDPLTFVNGGYGAQLGVRPGTHLRFAIASFDLHVPDVVSQINGNDGFDVRVLPSGAFYALYYLGDAGSDGLAFGGSVRYLRLRYEHDAFPGQQARVNEVSPELIVAYQWHPFHNGFYLQPWLALGVAVSHSAPAVVGTRTYDELPVSPFATVNIGWEQRL